MLRQSIKIEHLKSLPEGIFLTLVYNSETGIPSNIMEVPVVLSAKDETGLKFITDDGTLVVIPWPESHELNGDQSGFSILKGNHFTRLINKGWRNRPLF